MADPTTQGPPNDTPPAFDVAGALKAGYTPTEIAQHLSQDNKFDYTGAVKAGYTDTDIIDHLVPQGNLVNSIVEPVLNKVSQVVAKPAGDIAGLAATGYDAITGNKDSMAPQFKNYVENSLTYQPRTQAGLNATNTTNDVLANTVGIPGQLAKKGIASLGGGDVAQAGAQEAANQAVGIVGAKVLPEAAAAAKPYVDNTINAAGNAANWVASKMQTAAKSKAASYMAPDAVLGGMFEPATIPVMAKAAAPLAAVYGATKVGGPLLKTWAENRAGYQPGKFGEEPPLMSIDEAEAAGNAYEAEHGALPNSPSSGATTLPYSANAPSGIQRILQSPGSPGAAAVNQAGNNALLYQQQMANAIRQAPTATQQASVGANNSAANATTAAVQAATTGAGLKTPTRATQSAVINKVVPLTANQMNAASELQKMGLSQQTAMNLVRNQDPNQSSAQIQIAALRGK